MQRSRHRFACREGHGRLGSRGRHFLQSANSLMISSVGLLQKHYSHVKYRICSDKSPGVCSLKLPKFIRRQIKADCFSNTGVETNCHYSKPSLVKSDMRTAYGQFSRKTGPFARPFSGIPTKASEYPVNSCFGYLNLFSIVT